MALNLADRVRETTNVVGTGPATLLGAVAGYQAFSVVGDANTCYYTIADQQGVNWEVGIGTYSSTGPTLTRTTILSSSNAGSVVNFTFGTKDIFLTYPSEKAVYLDGSGNVQPNLGAASFTSITDSGNLTFTGTGNRITGDFSSAGASVGSRVAFQTSTANAPTIVGVIPNGTNPTTSISLFNNSDPVNSSLAAFNSTSTDARLLATIVGTGTYLPLTMYTGGSERLRIDTSGNVGIGTSTVSFKTEIQQGNGSASPSLRQTPQLVLKGYGGSGTFHSGIGFSMFEHTNGYWGSGILEVDDSGSYGAAMAFYTSTGSATPTPTERMRIDSSGNVGIGITPTSYASSTSNRTLQIYNSSANTAELRISNSTTGTGASVGALIQQSGNDMYVWNASNSFMSFGTNTTERMRIDASGNVGIGTTIAAGSTPKLQIASAFTAATAGAPYSGIFVNSTDAQAANLGGLISFGGNYDASSGPTRWAAIAGLKDNSTSGDYGGYLAMYTRPNGNVPAERMRITSSGEVYIAGTSDQGAYNLQVNGTGVWGAGAYVNGSDARIKEEVAPIDSGLDVVAKLNPVTYRYKEDWTKDQSTQTGFIAQELLVALEGKNYVDGVVQQGGEYMSVAYQNLIPVLTKAIQEQQTLIENLTTRLNALEGN